MNAQDWIAAAIALLAFFFLLWRFGAIQGIRQVFSSGATVDTKNPGGCAKCGDE